MFFLRYVTELPEDIKRETHMAAHTTDDEAKAYLAPYVVLDKEFGTFPHKCAALAAVTGCKTFGEAIYKGMHGGEALHLDRALREELQRPSEPTRKVFEHSLLKDIDISDKYAYWVYRAVAVGIRHKLGLQLYRKGKKWTIATFGLPAYVGTTAADSLAMAKIVEPDAATILVYRYKYLVFCEAINMYVATLEIGEDKVFAVC